MLRESPYTQMICQNGCLQPTHWIFYVPDSTYSEPAFWNSVSFNKLMSTLSSLISLVNVYSRAIVYNIYMQHSFNLLCNKRKFSLSLDIRGEDLSTGWYLLKLEIGS